MFDITLAVARAQDAVNEFLLTGIPSPRLSVGNPEAYFKWFDARESILVFMNSKGQVTLIR
jgi:hypothetical protein